MNEVNKCPKCGKFMFGDYCFSCDINIYDYKDNFEETPKDSLFENIFKNLFGEKNDKI